MHGRGLGFGFVGAGRGEIAKPSQVIVMAGLIGDVEHAFHVVLGVGLFHTSVVPVSEESTQCLELLFIMASVVGRVGRGGQKAGSCLVEAPQIKGSLEPHMGFGGKVAQVAEVLDKRARRLVCKNVVNA